MVGMSLFLCSVLVVVGTLQHSLYPSYQAIQCCISSAAQLLPILLKCTLLHQFGGAMRVKHFQEALEPMRLILQEQPFLGGASPNFADLAVGGNFAVHLSLPIVSVRQEFLLQ